jgi:hypothetical protein
MARAIGGARSSASEDFLAGKIERPSQGMPEPCIIVAASLLHFTLVITIIEIGIPLSASGKNPFFDRK